MILITAVDDSNGLMFNKRRQSQDRVLRRKILDMTAGSKLWMNHYSYKQFASDQGAERINVDDNFLSEASPGEYCFVENVSTAPYEKWIERLVVFHWNRKYPGDFFFDIDYTKDWSLVSSEEFPGSSHEKITMEVYSK